MLKVPQQQYIRHLRETEGCAIQEIAERVDVNWRTAKKYADRDDWNAAIVPRTGHHPVLGPHLDAIDTWLLDDERLPRKQHHTARRIFHRLQTEYGFTGGERTVSDYVAKRKTSLRTLRTESYERLEHPGGEAQADFGTVYIVKGGGLVERKILTLSFPYSNAAFVFPVPKENTECFLEALRRLFEQIDGVPSKIWFDNLSAAVVSIQADGRRVLTDAFSQFCAHYRFDPQFCNPGSGNEKGHVENKVGYGRRNWCVPPPVMETPEQFETHLRQAAAADMDRTHYAKPERIADLWGQERARLRVLPLAPLEVFRLETGRLNKYSELPFDGTLFPLPQCPALQAVWLKVKWDTIEVLTADGTYQPLATLPRPYTEKAMPLDWSAIFAGYRKRPRAVLYSSFIPMMPPAVAALLQSPDPAVRRSRIALLQRCLETYTLAEVGQALPGVTDPQEGPLATRLEHALYALRHPAFAPTPFAETHTPVAIQGQIPALEAYDRALGVRMQ